MTSKEPTPELATRPADAIQRPPATSMLEVIERAALDPRIDVAKMKELFALKRELEHDEAVKAFRAAKSRLAVKLPHITKHGNIIHEKNGETKLISRYAKLEDIDVAIRPLLAEEGFAFSFDSEAKGDVITYSAELSHRDGHAETKMITVKADTSGAKNSIQAVGSSTSYARRMLIKMHLNLIERDEDDDGNGNSVELISKEHAAEIAGLLAAARDAGLPGFADDRWLKWLTVSTFDAMLERDFARVRDAIKRKRAEAEAKAAEAKAAEAKK